MDESEATNEAEEQPPTGTGEEGGGQNRKQEKSLPDESLLDEILIQKELSCIPKKS